MDKDIIRIKKPIFILIVLVILFGFASPAIADYLGPNRTVTTAVEVCKVVLWECMYVPAKGDYRYHRVDDWSCSNESKPWLAYQNYPGDCESWNVGRTQWGQEYSVSLITITHPEAIIQGTLQNCTLQNGWCVTSPQLALTGSEPLSGYSILIIEGTRNGETFACAETNCSVPLDEGINDFTYWAISSWGDSSRMGTTSAKVDTVPPDIHLNINGSSGTNGWYISQTKVTVSGTDSTSGLAEAVLSVDGGAWDSSARLLEDGVHTINLRAMDHAGNISTASTTILIDTIPPAIALTSEINLGEAFKYSLQDDGSGLYLVRIVIEDDEERFPKVAWEEHVSGNKFKDEFIWDGKWKDDSTAPIGEYFITVKASDAAGNERIQSGIVKINPLSYIQPPPPFTPPESTGTNNELADGQVELGPATSIVPSASFDGTNTRTFSFAGAVSGATANTTSSNVLWGAVAAIVIGAATAAALQEQKKRKEEEAAQIAQVTAEVEAKNEAIEAQREATQEQWRIQNWLQGQAMLNAQIETLKAQGASQDAIDALKSQAATQGLSTALANSAGLSQFLQAQKIAEASTADMTETQEWEAYVTTPEYQSQQAALLAWEAEKERERLDELQAGLMAYYEGRIEGEKENESRQDNTWAAKAWNWAFNNQIELSLGTGIVVGVVAVLAVAGGIIVSPWLAIGAAVLATAALVTVGTVAINNHFGLSLGNNLATNLIFGTAAALLTAGIGILVTTLAPAIGTTITTMCANYATACSQIGTIIDAGEEAFLTSQIAYYTWMGNQDGAAQAVIELQLEQMDGGAPGNSIAMELSEQIAKLGPDATELIVKHGSDIVPLLLKYGDDAVDIIRTYGDEGVSLFTLYGDNAVDFVRRAQAIGVNPIGVLSDPLLPGQSLNGWLLGISDSNNPVNRPLALDLSDSQIKVSSTQFIYQ